MHVKCPQQITMQLCIMSSAISSSPPLHSYYFQLLAVGTGLSRGYLGIIKFFGWKKVAIITQNENVYSVVRDAWEEGGRE